MVAGLLMHISFWFTPAKDLMGQDIYYIWLEGKRIIAGENPYARILASDMRDNDKYATYFPLAYLFSALIQKLGFPEFLDWLYVWRPISFSFHLGLIALTLRYFYARGFWLLGFAAATVLLLGRWSVYITRVHHLEFAAVFFLLLSLVLLKEKSRLSLLAFSISLGIKQIAIFLLPLYLIHLWVNGAKDRRVQAVAWGFLIILSVPALTSLPFLFWNAEGFLKSILFSATRAGSSHIESAPSLDIIFSQNLPWLVGLKAKLLMLLLMGLVYLSFWKERITILASSAVIMMVFLYFNSVLFLQYFLWPLSLTLLALVELVPPLPPQKPVRIDGNNL
ncbi:hypothetical protein H6F55_01650 [Phormidium sp. FACHB-322]|nr:MULTISPECIES: hypothetical protein [Cyanophyceae]MBD1918437.1 hypothetical protein [Phormidium sp. FACHB-77]MBD2028694.1 hypothetical protein [Phormidium sp. FACHB-322]MBD2051115.1 hypothetical protein [Leptolyngbya sp. FACHB-60]